MRVLVTGGGGFVGRRLVARLASGGHAVVAGVGPGSAGPAGAPSVALDITHDGCIAAALEPGMDAVVHLAAVSSGGDARRSPGVAWEVNAAGTARLAEAVAASGARLLLVSTAEVYGAGTGPRREDEAPMPLSPYAASKLAGELAVQEVGRRLGLPHVIIRPFPHTGAGQDTRFVIPAFAERIRQAVARGEGTVRVGNLEPVRDFLHVDDVVDAYVDLLDAPPDGTIYNVASGSGLSIGELFRRLARLAGADVEAVTDPTLIRPADIPELIGDAGRLRAATGWRPRRDVDTALREVLGAEAD